MTFREKIKHKRRKAIRIMVWTVSVAITIFILQLLTLSIPYPLFSYKTEIHNLTFYSDREIDSNMTEIFNDIYFRLSQTEVFKENSDLNIMICHDRDLYNIFSRLTFVPSHVPGFNLSMVDNSFISVTILNKRFSSNGGFPKYSAIGGGLAQCIAHELIHNYVVEKIGYFSNRKLPRWKTEGYSEFAASIAISRTDTTSTLVDRIWNLTNSLSNEQAREYYRWGLVIEYLSEIENLKFDQIMDKSLTLDESSMRMMSWYNQFDK